MAYHIKKPSALITEITVYYKGDSRWTDKFDDRKTYDADPSALLVNDDGTNGGWTGAIIVDEG
tara:strand:- start:386 stop:574 length:189 start_codon:yes stop_codon:yes gene_type:complete